MDDPVEFEIQKHITNKDSILQARLLLFCVYTTSVQITQKRLFPVIYFLQCNAGPEGKHSFKMKNANTSATPAKAVLASLLLTLNRYWS